MVVKKNERKERSDKRIRVNVSMEKFYHDKLKKLSVSCDMTKTKLAYEIIKTALDHPDFVSHFQKVYNKDSKYLVRIVKENGIEYYE